MFLRRGSSVALLIACGTFACERGTQDLEALLELRPQAIDFGAVTLGHQESRQAMLINHSSGVLELRELSFDGHFELAPPGLPASIAAGASLPMEIVFAPVLLGKLTGGLAVETDRFTASMTLIGTGIRSDVVGLELDPTIVNFGTVEIGSEAVQRIEVRSIGLNPVMIEAITLESTGRAPSDSDDFRLENLPNFPILIAPQTETVLPLIFAPAAGGDRMRSDRLLFDTGEAEVPLEMLGQAIQRSGSLSCAPAQLNLGRVERGTTASGFVTCTAFGARVRIVQAEIAPPVSPFSLAPRGTDTIEPGQSVMIEVLFASEGLPAMHNASLEITYQSTDQPATFGIALAGETISPSMSNTAASIELRWDRIGDLDLHLVRSGHVPFSAKGGDCHFADPMPDWGVTGDPTDDPFLDLDDTDGIGPERINLGPNTRDSAQVIVHSFSDQGAGPTLATLQVFVAGQLVATATRTLACDDFWTAGVLTATAAIPYRIVDQLIPNYGRGTCP